MTKFLTTRCKSKPKRRAGALAAMVGKTIQDVAVDFPGPSITLSFTDGTSVGILNTSKSAIDVDYFVGGEPNATGETIVDE